MFSDIGNLKYLSKLFRAQLTVDYYVVFCELEAQMKAEFDFRNEARAMDKVGRHLRSTSGGQEELVIPRAVPGMVTR